MLEAHSDATHHCTTHPGGKRGGAGCADMVAASNESHTQGFGRMRWHGGDGGQPRGCTFENTRLYSIGAARVLKIGHDRAWPRSARTAGTNGMPGEAASTVFVGGISPGVSDRWLKRLFEVRGYVCLTQACGGFLSLKRVTKAFGFVDFASLRDVLRALSVLHDRELPSMGTFAGEPRRRLVVRADEKTSAFLSEFERSIVRTEADSQEETTARRRVEHIVKAMSRSDADASDDPIRYEIPSHLKDLPVNELPPDRRRNVLSEIEKFRRGAVARDAEDRQRELDLERRRQAALQARHSPAARTPVPEGPDDPLAADEEAERLRRREEAERRATLAREVRVHFVAYSRRSVCLATASARASRAGTAGMRSRRWTPTRSSPRGTRLLRRPSWPAHRSGRIGTCAHGPADAAGAG